MTAEAIDIAVLERRSTPRFRFSFLMPAVLGRGDALIQDVSAEGARVTHFAALPLGSMVRLVFFYAGRRFAANARVLACRVVGLGNGPDGETSYQSRLQFTDASTDAAETLAHIVRYIEVERMRDWEANAAGEQSSKVHDDGAHYFMRARYLGQRWIKCWTRDDAQPEDGFTVPAKLSDGEVDILCDAYQKMDAAGRDLIRASAAEAA